MTATLEDVENHFQFRTQATFPGAGDKTAYAMSQDQIVDRLYELNKRLVENQERMRSVAIVPDHWLRLAYGGWELDQLVEGLLMELRLRGERVFYRGSSYAYLEVGAFKVKAQFPVRPLEKVKVDEKPEF